MDFFSYIILGDIMKEYNFGKPSYDKRLIPVLIDKGIFVNERIYIQNMEYLVTCVTVIDPYVVVLNQKIEEIDINDTALKINYDRVFPYKVNIVFSEVIDNEIYIKIWKDKNIKSYETAAAAALVANTINNNINKDEEILIHNDNDILVGIFKSDDDVIIREKTNLKVKSKKVL